MHSCPKGGSRGLRGATGPAGPAGVSRVGVTGPMGPSDNTGPAGPIGANGAEGGVGPTGPNAGLPTNFFEVQAGNTVVVGQEVNLFGTTLDITAIPGSVNVQFENLNLIPGPPGPSGATGEEGDKGPAPICECCFEEILTGEVINSVVSVVPNEDMANLTFKSRHTTLLQDVEIDKMGPQDFLPNVSVLGLTDPPGVAGPTGPPGTVQIMAPPVTETSVQIFDYLLAERIQGSPQTSVLILLNLQNPDSPIFAPSNEWVSVNAPVNIITVAQISPNTEMYRYYAPTADSQFFIYSSLLELLGSTSILDVGNLIQSAIDITTNRAYIASDSVGILTLDISDPSMINFISVSPVPFNASSVDIIDNFLIVAEFLPANIRIINLNTMITTFFPLDVSPVYVFVYSINTLVVLTQSPAIIFINISNKLEPDLIEEIPSDDFFPIYPIVFKPSSQANTVYVGDRLGGFKTFIVEETDLPLTANKSQQLTLANVSVTEVGSFTIPLSPTQSINRGVLVDDIWVLPISNELAAQNSIISSTIASECIALNSISIEDLEVDNLTILRFNLPATIFYVSPSGDNSNDGLSWLTSKATLENAITSASNYSQIVLAPGTYSQNTDLIIDRPLLIRGYTYHTATINIGNTITITLNHPQAHVQNMRLIGNNSNLQHLSGYLTYTYIQGFSEINVVEGLTSHNIYEQIVLHQITGTSKYTNSQLLNNLNTAISVLNARNTILDNCTIPVNSIGFAGDSLGIMRNTIATSNNINDATYQDYSSVEATKFEYNNVQSENVISPEGPNGPGNINADTLFAASQELQLSAYSPCIGAGFEGQGMGDLQDNLRFSRQQPEIGASAFVHASEQLVLFSDNYQLVAFDPNTNIFLDASFCIISSSGASGTCKLPQANEPLGRTITVKNVSGELIYILADTANTINTTLNNIQLSDNSSIRLISISSTNWITY